MNKTIKTENALAEIFSFTNGSEVAEYHVMIHAMADGLTFQQQLDAVLDSYEQLKATELKGATAVLKRYFLSDIQSRARSPRFCLILLD